MRRWWVGVVAVVLAVAVGVWWWLREDAPAPAEEVSQAAAANEGGLPAVLQASKWSAPIVQRGARAVSGLVLRDGQPVPGAVVTAIASHGDDVLSDLPCQCDNHCGQKLLACGCAEASGQLVELVGARTGEGTPLGRATTDAEGAFSITGLDETKLTLWADAPGGVAWKSEVPSDAADVRLALLPGRFLKGSVKKTDGSPAAGALVTAIFAEQSRFFDVVADAKGGFRVGPLPRGKYAVVGMQSGLLPDHQTIGDDADDEVSLELSIPRTLSGTVVRAGAPVAGATVKLEGMHRKRTVLTDAQGAFHLERLRPGSYELDAEIGAELTHATAVVSKHEDRTGVVLTLQRGVSLSGLVTDPRGAALSDVKVSLLDHEVWRRATSDATGHFSFPVASEGAHQLSASRRGSLTWSEEVKGPEVRITLKDSSVLSGRVVDGEGQLVPRFTISASLVHDGGAPLDGYDFDEGERGAAEGLADEESSTDGGFALDLVPGRFEVQVEAAAFAPMRLEATAPGEVVITLKMGAKVRGQVVDLDGVPASGVQVSSRSEGRERHSTRASTDVEGRFLLEGLGAGRHALVALQTEEGLRTWTAQATVTLTEGATTEVLLRPSAGVAVAGVVLSDRGEPVSEVTVTGWGESRDGGYEPAAASMTKTDSEGHFRLRTLPAGALSLMAQAKGSTPITARVVAPDEHIVLRLKSATTVSGRVVDEQGKPVKSFALLHMPLDTEDGRFERPARPGKSTLAIDADGFAQHIFEVDLKPGPNDVGDVVLSRGRVLTGVVTDALTHQPIEGALLDVGASEPKGTVYLSERNGAVRTDAEGRYRFASVDPTSSWISVTHPTYVTTHKPLAPFMTSLDVALGSGGTLNVKVMDALGQPVRETRGLASSPTGGWKPLAPSAPGVLTATGLAPGRWQVQVQVRSQAKYRPLEVEVKAGPQEIVAREATDGVTVKFDVAGGSQFMVLNEGTIATPTNRSELEGLRSAEAVTGSVARNVLPGTWTLILMRQQGQGQEIASHTFQVTARGDQEVKVTPQWRAISFE